MKRTLTIAACAAAMIPSAWACSPPSAPGEMPNGKTATKEVMMAKKKEVDGYKKDMESYLSCESNTKKQETAQAELERVAGTFNAEVRAFKAANAGT